MYKTHTLSQKVLNENNINTIIGLIENNYIDGISVDEYNKLVLGLRNLTLEKAAEFLYPDEPQEMFDMILLELALEYWNGFNGTHEQEEIGKLYFPNGFSNYDLNVVEIYINTHI